MWLYLCIASAFFLGFYDVFKKWSVRDNAPLLVLFLTVCFGAAVTVPVLGWSLVHAKSASVGGLFCRMLTSHEHLLVLSKAVIVSVSWIAAFFALKHLPISIVAPIRASAPLWTLIGAVLLLKERLSALHLVAVAIILLSYFAFSIIGRKEGIHFLKDRWILLVVIATLSGAASALYDKYLLRNAGIDPISLQVWFSIHLVAVIGAVTAAVRLHTKDAFKSFKWRRTIPLVGILLIIADFLYFRALAHEDALIAVVSAVRRSSVIISFIAGGLLFREKNKRKKAIPLIGVLVGIALLLVKG